MIELKNINIQYDQLLLKQDYLNFYPGQLTLIMGESGCGKTALLYRLSLMTMDCIIDIDGKNINQLSSKEIADIQKNQISIVLQTNDMINHLSVYDNLKLYSMMSGYNFDENYMYQLIDDLKLDISLEQQISTLSLGEKKRVCIACALMKHPQILILDEPTSALDKKNTHIIYQFLKEYALKNDCLIICTSHDSISVDYADRIYSFEQQQLICTKDCPYQKRVLSFDIKPIHKQFIKNYVHLYIDRFQLIHRLMIILNMILAFILLFSNVYLQYNNKTIEEQLYHQYDNVLLITPSSKQLYIDQIDQYIQINNNQLYPIYKIKVFGLDDCYIVPYFNEDFITDKINSYMGKHVSKGTFLSNQTQYQLSQLMNLQQNIELPIVINQQYFNIELTINGTLKDGVKQYYSSNEDLYIYMYYEEYYHLFDSYIHSHENVGYIQLCDDMDSVKEARQVYLDQGYGVNDENIFYKQINDIMNYQNKVIVQWNISIWIISILMIACLYVYSFIKRKSEYALLILNGIYQSTLLKISLYEMIYRNKYIIFICLIFSMLSLLLNSHYTFICLYTLVYLCILSIVILMIYLFLFYNLNVEKTLRN